jgi:hypothetical protein
VLDLLLAGAAVAAAGQEARLRLVPACGKMSMANTSINSCEGGIYVDFE